MINEQIKILDSTLREGLQSIYAENIKSMKFEYVHSANKLGILNFEYNNVLFSDTELREFLLLIDKFSNSTFYMHFYLNDKNVNKLLTIPEIEFISTFIPYKYTGEHISLIKKILSSGKKIRVSIENGFGLSSSEIEDLFLSFKNIDCINRLSFSDTIGMVSPKDLALKLEEFANIGFFEENDVEFHFHNDRGLAIANALTVIEHMSLFKKNIYLSVSAFGIGERNGILPLQGLLANLKFLNILSEKNIFHLSSFNEMFYERGIFFDTTPLGINAFHHSATSHIMLSPEDYSQLEPKKFNMKNKIVVQHNSSDEVIMGIIKKFYGSSSNEIFTKIKKEFSNGKKFFILDTLDQNIFL